MLQSFPEVTLIPDKINFPKTFPGKSVECKVLMGNSGIKPEEYTLSVTGDSEFTIPTNKITIPPGGTYAMLVSFKPTKIAVYNGAVIFEGRYPFSLTLTGHCVPSIFEIPPPHAKCWTFSPDETDQLIQFSNRDVSKTLSVAVQTNTNAFTIEPPAFDIQPLSTFSAKIHYDKTKSSVSNPMLSISCSQTEEMFEIPLQIGQKRETIKFNLGTTLVNRILKKEFKLMQEEQAPSVSWPFSIVSNGEKQNKLNFEFSSPKPGEFSTTVSMQDFDILLSAEAKEIPFSINVPDQFPKTPFTIFNRSKDILQIQLTGYGIHLQKNYVTIAPGEIAHVVCDENDVIQPGASLKLVWEHNGTIFTEEIPFKVTEATELNPSSIKSSSALKSSSESERTEISINRSTQSTKRLKANTHLVVFSGSSRRFPLKITSDLPVIISPPPFIRLPRNYKPNDPFNLKLHNEDSDIMYGFITIRTKLDEIRIPAIAMPCVSQLDIPESISINRIGNLSIKNYGKSTAYVNLQSQDAKTSKTDLIIKPGVTSQIEVQSEKDSEILVTSKEILTTKIEEFLEGKDTDDSKLNDVLQQCRTKDLKALCEYSTTTKTVKVLVSNESKKSNFSVSVDKLVFYGSDSQSFSLINMSSAPTRFQVTVSSPFISVDPLSGYVSPYSSLRFEVNALKKVDGEITIKIGGEVLKITTSCQEKSLVVSTSSSAINFPSCKPGTMRRASLKVSNKSSHKTFITAKCEAPFFCPFPEFEIDPMSYVLLPVHFTPQIEDSFNGLLTLETDSRTSVEVIVHGICC
ncbi:hypothetical protein TVAG_375230 [Trichomonas vaginalis G3]|uniref:Abnormal spindle-like microcephaly-associated protein ASH domain-containing protein n=1 Tax=Trichomonas vaginalis (strain ATCC PRA-98 / G3) TaxID=412133 RepID=A2FH01_TRIV3|nr:hypothetical protein TVAGG3_0859240 [Trichomonas vaginalis G3]EAX95814.1 hypothetical protein TVAG_375230 [Trichomonas vaginalis G3]KAI5500549.1 hypothetical protein TVAGG3_0859240 [Trichomonas vaginalis G3]|eukprot:XP_001308744.1 hypothetical protein [Trichomonas vaginalis G3]